MGSLRFFCIFEQFRSCLLLFEVFSSIPLRGKISEAWVLPSPSLWQTLSANTKNRHRLNLQVSQRGVLHNSFHSTSSFAIPYLHESSGYVRIFLVLHFNNTSRKLLQSLHLTLIHFSSSSTVRAILFMVSSFSFY